MTLEQVFWASQCAAAVGVIASLIFVGVEVRNNARAVRSATAQAVEQSFAGIYLSLQANRSTLESCIKGVVDYDALRYVLSVAGALITVALTPNAFAVSDANTSSKSAVEEIRLLEQDRNQAILRGDAAALERMTADDDTFITLRGEMVTKAEIVRNFRSGAAKYQSREISDLNIRVYGNSAVVTGRAIQKGMENGKDYSGDYWFTRVYVKQGGHWMTVALQTTLIK